MDQDSPVLARAHRPVRRSGRRMPTFYRSRPVGRSLRRPMAAPSSRVWELEQRLQKVCPLGRPGYLGTVASAFRRRPGYGIPHHRQHGGPGPPLRCGSAEAALTALENVEGPPLRCGSAPGLGVVVAARSGPPLRCGSAPGLGVVVAARSGPPLRCGSAPGLGVVVAARSGPPLRCGSAPGLGVVVAARSGPPLRCGSAPKSSRRTSGTVSGIRTSSHSGSPPFYRRSMRWPVAGLPPGRHEPALPG